MDGKLVGLALTDYEGRRVKVAVLKEMESGERHLRILEPPALAGREFDLPRSKVNKIKRFFPCVLSARGRRNRQASAMRAACPAFPVVVTIG